MIAENKNIVNYTLGSNRDIQRVLEKNFDKAVKQVKQNNFYLKFKGSTPEEVANNVWEYLKENVTYKADGYHQKIVLPARLKIGDCKSLSLFAAAILYCYYPNNVFLRYVSYSDNSTPTHVYTILRIGSKEIIIDAVWHTFNSQKNYTFKKDVKMRISTLSGIEGMNTPQERQTTRQIIKRLIKLRDELPSGDAKRQSITFKIRSLKDSLVGIEGKKGKGGKGGKGGVKKIALAAPRNAYLGLVKLNVRGLATRLKKALDKDKAKVQSKWEKLGGKFSSFEKAILVGAKKKPFLGAKKIKGLDEYLSEDITIGEPATATAVGTFLATAGPVIATLGKLLSSLKISDKEDELLTDESGNAEPVSEDTEVTDKEKGGFSPSPLLIIGGIGVLGLGYFLMKK